MEWIQICRYILTSSRWKLLLHEQLLLLFAPLWALQTLPFPGCAGEVSVWSTALEGLKHSQTTISLLAWLPGPFLCCLLKTFYSPSIITHYSKPSLRYTECQLKGFQRGVPYQWSASCQGGTRPTPYKANTQETLLWFVEHPAHLTFLLEQWDPTATGRQSILTAANPSVKPITSKIEYRRMEKDFKSEFVSSYKNKTSGLGDPGALFCQALPLWIIKLHLWRRRRLAPTGLGCPRPPWEPRGVTARFHAWVPGGTEGVAAWRMQRSRARAQRSSPASPSPLVIPLGFPPLALWDCGQTPGAPRLASHAGPPPPAPHFPPPPPPPLPFLKGKAAASFRAPHPGFR